jgi:hypothetical protein
MILAFYAIMTSFAHKPIYAPFLTKLTINHQNPNIQNLNFHNQLFLLPNAP